MKTVYVFKQLLPKRYVGITLWPFIFLKHEYLKRDPELMNHERIHLRQQMELLIIPFFVLYLMEWLLKYMWYGNPHIAYYNISFEKEAYDNEGNLEYLEKRPFWNFVKYLF